MSEFRHEDSSHLQRQLTMGRHHVPPERGRSIFFVFFLFILVLAALVFLAFRMHGLMQEVEYRFAADANGEGRLIAMGLQMDSLKGKLNNLLADSVEIRIKSLESAIAAGRVTQDDILNFQSLQNDLKTLEAYARAGGAPQLETGLLEPPRLKAIGSERVPALGNQAIMAEITTLRRLFYWCLTGLVLGGGTLAGRRIWLRSHSHRGLLTHRPRRKSLPARRQARLR